MLRVSVLVPLLLASLLIGCGKGSEGAQAQSEVEQLRQAQASYDNGSYQQAAEQLESFIENNPNSPEIEPARYALAKSYYWLARYPDAIKLFTELHTQGQTVSQAKYLYWRGKSYVKSRQYQEGETDFDQVMQLHETSTYVDNADLAKARLPYDQVQDLNSASSDYQQNYQAWLNDAVTRLESFITRRPDSGLLDDAYYTLGRSHQELNSPVEAKAQFDYIVETLVLSSLRDNAYYQNGMLLYQQAEIHTASGNLTEAINNYGLAIEHWQAVDTITDFTNTSAFDDIIYFTARAHVETGDVYLMLADDVQADTAFLQAKAVFQTLRDGYTGSGWRDNAMYNIAKLDYDRLEYASAIAEFDTLANTYCGATMQSSLCDQTLYFRGRSKQKQAIDMADAQGFQAAIIDFQLVTTAYPDSTWADNAAYQVGKVWYEQADYVKAIQVFETVLSATYLNQSAYDEATYYLARSYAFDSDAQSAKLYFQQFIDAYEQSPLLDNAYWGLSAANHDLGDCPAELASLQTLLNWPYEATLGPVGDITLGNAQTHADDLVPGQLNNHTCIVPLP